MENAADALKLAFAALAFVLALGIAVSLIGQANATARQVFYSTDTTSYLDPERYGGTAEHRTVSLETIIPTLYRYSVENCGITIIDKNGNIVLRYDVETGNAAGSYLTYNKVMNSGGDTTDNITASDTVATQNYLKHVEYLTIILNSCDGIRNHNTKYSLGTQKEFKAEIDGNISDVKYIYNEQVDEAIQRLYQYKYRSVNPDGSLDSTESTRYGAPWAATGYDSERIEADLYGYTNNSNCATYARKGNTMDTYGIDQSRYLVYNKGLLSSGESYSLFTNSNGQAKTYTEYVIDDAFKLVDETIEDNELMGRVSTQSNNSNMILKNKKTEIIFVEN